MSNLAPVWFYCNPCRTGWLEEEEEEKAPSCECTETATVRSHCWCSPSVTLLSRTEFELLISKVLTPSMEPALEPAQPLIILALRVKCSCQSRIYFWATEYSLLRRNFSFVIFYPTASSPTSAALESSSSLSVLLPFTNLKAVLSILSLLSSISLVPAAIL